MRTTGHYGVDGLNRRISKSVGGSIQRAWAYDGARVVAEINGATFLTWRFVYGTRPQVPDYMIHGKSGEVYRLLTDHLGSVRLVVRLLPQAALGFTSRDASGALVMEEAEHALTRTFRGKGVAAARADAGLSFRSVLARDIRDVRRIAGTKYDNGIRDLLQYYRDNFPGLIRR